MPRQPSIFLPDFSRDVENTIRWSEEHFGMSAADRYVALIRQSIRDIRADPARPGAKARPDIARYAFVYHLSFSRDRVNEGRVKTPRHFILYRFSGTRVEFIRLLHDSRDLARHLPEIL